MTAGPAWTQLRQAIDRVERRGTAPGLAVRGPGGARFDHGGDRRFIAASTVKIPVLIELFRQAEAGSLSLSDPYRLQPGDKAGGSGVLSGLGDGLTLTLADLAFLMMSISDNTATNALIGRLGLPRIQDRMRALGMRRSTLAHTMRGRHVDDPAHENWAVPAEYAAVLGAVLDGTAASPESCAAVLALMRQQQNDRRIARHLPPEQRAHWGSKTGSLPGITNDCGFVVTGAGPVVLAIFLGTVPDAHTGEAMVGDLARAALADLDPSPARPSPGAPA